MPVIQMPAKPLTNLVKRGTVARDITTHGEAAGWERLLANRRIRSLTVHSLTESAAAILAKLRSVEILILKNCDFRDLSCVGGLTGLCELQIHTAPRIKDFTFLAKLRKLRSLKFVDVTKFKDPSILEALPALRTLKISMMFSWTALPTLAPFARLNQVRSLSLGFRVRDGSLSPLANLTKLRELHLPLTYRLEEYAKLAVALPNVECSRLAKPYGRSLSSFLTCKRCGGTERLTLAHGRRALCPTCDREKFKAYLGEFEELKRNIGR